MREKHPKGLILLFSTEMWERFSFYAMRSLLVLYITARVLDGGLGWTKKEALTLYGIYVGTAYLTPLVGGYLSDRFLGQRRSAMIGAWMMAIGHFFMAFNVLWMFYSALCLIALGNGLFKPCLTSILGQLYDDSDESHRDSAYSIFYMGINIGALLSGVVSGWLLNNYGFDYGFAAAGVGMLIALGIFYWGKDRYLESVGIAPSVKVKDHHVIPLTAEEKSHLGVIAFLFFIILLFIIAWEQLGGLMTLFIQENVNRTVGNWQIPTPWLTNFNPFFVILLAPTLSLLWNFLGNREKDPFVGIKMGLGCIFLALSFIILSWMTRQVHEPVSPEELPHWGWIVLNQLFLVLGELCVIPISWAAATKLSPRSYTHPS